MPLKESGKLYEINGEKIMLYPISRLVTELERIGYSRNSQTIRKWEDKGVTPESLFRFGKKRLYSKEQIETFCRVARECDIKQGLNIAITGFSEQIWEELTELNKKYTN